MELYLDTANVADIKELKEILTIDGVTTNPSILCKESDHYTKVIKDITSLLTDDQKLFMQVISRDYEGILNEARKIAGLRPKNMYVKIPVTDEGLKAIRVLHEEGINILATAIFSAPQALLAARNGADYLAPYVNRMENYGDGVAETLLLHDMLKNYDLPAKIIAASFKNVEQVKRLLAGGIEAITVPSDICRRMYKHPGTDEAVDEFTEKWQQRFKENRLSL